MATQTEEALGEHRVELTRLREHVDLLLIELAALRPLASEVATLRERLAANEDETTSLRAALVELESLRHEVTKLAKMKALPTSRAWPAVALVSWAVFANLTALLLAMLASTAYAK